MMKKDDMFEFVNDIESDIEEQKNEETSIKPIQPATSIEEAMFKQERNKRIEIIRTILLLGIISLVIFVFTLIWQDDLSLMGITNALWLVVIMQFFVGWMMLMNNMNILSPLVHGAKTFGKMIIGKRMDIDYITYLRLKQDNPIPRYYYMVCFIAALINAIPAVILLFIV